MSPELPSRFNANLALDQKACKHAVAVNFDDISGPVLYEPDAGIVHRGFKDVFKALTEIFNEEPASLTWIQVFVQSSDLSEQPWCSCSMHKDSSENLSQIVTPKVRACMHAP